MYLNRWVLLLSLIIGALGIWSIQRAFVDYRQAAESFTEVSVSYVPDSFVWRDPTYSTGQADFRVVNDTPEAVTIELAQLRLYFDGAFAGAEYAGWEPVVVPEGEEMRFTSAFQVTTPRLDSRGDEAEISVRGDLRLRFDGIERPLVVRVRDTIGRVAEVREE